MSMCTNELPMNTAKPFLWTSAGTNRAATQYQQHCTFYSTAHRTCSFNARLLPARVFLLWCIDTEYFLHHYFLGLSLFIQNVDICFNVVWKVHIRAVMTCSKRRLQSLYISASGQGWADHPRSVSVHLTLLFSGAVSNNYSLLQLQLQSAGSLHVAFRNLRESQSWGRAATGHQRENQRTFSL